MPLPTVSVVVPTHNRAHLLRHLLEALDAQDYEDYEVLIVDDASQDETPAVLAGWAGIGRSALRLKMSSGSYAARNRGWRAARGEIFAFTDDDCVPQPGWISGLVQAMNDPAVVGAQGVTLPTPGELTPFTHQIEQLTGGPPYRTCNVAYRRSTLEQLGGFDDRMRWYADNILGLRARRLGEIAFAPQAVVHHPPRPKEWRNRQTWRARFAADLEHRSVLRSLGAEPVTVPGGALPLVLWVLRPVVKESAYHLRYLLRHPVTYLAQSGPMVREKWELLLALGDYWREGRQQATPDGSAPLPALPDEPLVSVVVVTQDRLHLLPQTLAALDRQAWQRREVLVVDRGKSAQVELLAQRSGARYVPWGGGTLGSARQAGVDAAVGEIVAFTDDDCLPAPDWLASLVDAFLQRPDLYGVQGRTRPEGGPLGSHTIRVSHLDPLYQTCNIAYRREALAAAGGFDPRFAGWFEDTALAARVLEHGSIGFRPEAVVTHRAVPRVPLDRVRWRLLLEDERRLARDYPAFYRRTRGPAFLPTVVARWLLGSPVKTLWRELPRAPADPRGYLALAGLLIGERWQLLRALRDTHA